MTLSRAPDSPIAESMDLKGVRILVVEDSWNVGTALKRLLAALGADVAGPVATATDAERLASAQPPDAALVDFHLRGGERANSLIDRLHDQGVPVIVISGYAVLPLAAGKAAAILQKPITAAQLIVALRPVIAQKLAQ